MKHCIGIDIGGTKIAGGVVATDGNVLHRVQRPTPVKEGGPEILAQAMALAEELLYYCASHNVEASGIGIGAGGQIDSDRGLVYSATDVLPGWRGLEIAPAFEHKFALPTKVDNDVNVLALGECRFGAARAAQNGTVVFLALGTGVGGALVSGGKIHHGAHWSGGEFGHILLSMAEDARFDTGGSQGTLEAYCSGPGMVQTYRELIESEGSDPGEVEIHGHDVVAAAEAEKAKGAYGPGQKALHLTGRALGFGLVTLANALDPDLIIIGGGLSSLGELILAPAREILKKRAMPGPATCPVVTAGLEADAAIVGAACLVL